MDDLYDKRFFAQEIEQLFYEWAYKSLVPGGVSSELEPCDFALGNNFRIKARQLTKMVTPNGQLTRAQIGLAYNNEELRGRPPGTLFTIFVKYPELNDFALVHMVRVAFHKEGVHKLIMETDFEQ